MPKFKVVINYQNGDIDELDELFDSYEEAEEQALEYISNWHAGGEVLELSNPGDYPYDPDAAPDYDIFEEDDYEDDDYEDDDYEDDDEEDDENW